MIPVMDNFEQNRRRTLLATAMIVLTLMALLAWFLMHPSSRSSPARSIKTAVFGPRLTEAAEQFALEQRTAAVHTGGGQGQGGGAGEKPGQGGAKAGASVLGNNSAGGAGDTAGSGPAGTSSSGPGSVSGETGHGHGTPLSGPVTSPANPHDPANNPPELSAPAARSIGWLDRFFGTQSPDEQESIRPGEGGTGRNQPGTGNTNPTPGGATSAPVAAEFSASNPVTPAEVTLDEPPSLARSTNRAPQGNSTLNDNFEQLLRQHRAGSGDVRISLMWSNKNDLDLHVVDPHREEIFYGHRLAQSGGLLDIDMNASPPLRVPAVENIFWPQRAAPLGQYQVYVNHYRRHDVADLTPFTVRVLVRGETTDINGSIRFGDPKKLVYQFTLSRATQ
jgi:hypothetical protein